MKQTDFIIVGQGLAGTLLHSFLEKKGHSSMVIDPGHHHAASLVAAGIINPVTGRYYTKSWKIDELIPAAQATYHQLEKELNISIFQHRNILRSLFHQKDANDWALRMADPAYQKYMLTKVDPTDFLPWTQASFAYGELTHGAQVQLSVLVKAYRGKLLKNNDIVEEEFDYERLEVSESSFRYGAIESKQVVFCEGIGSTRNPFFNYLPFRGTKGEVLIIKIEEPEATKLLKHRLFLVPFGNQEYWVGSAYVKEYEDDLPTEEGRQKLLDQLQEVLNVPFEIVNHLSAIRPTVKDRRPFLGEHPTIPGMHIFNGLGTKGASLGPFFAQQMANFLDHDAPIDPLVNIERYAPKA